jgi:predicted nucleic acid-binding protein
MILVDTNVISETIRGAPAPQVIEWLNSQAVETLYLATVSLAELLYGIAALPEGRRKVELGMSLARQAALLFGDRVLPFDITAAESYAEVVSRARREGRAIGVADGQIAAIAHGRQLIVATRDTAPFLAAGVQVLDPWSGRTCT